MLRLLRMIIFGDAHLHKWKIIQKTECVDSSTKAAWTRHYCQCESCGTIKVFDV